MAKRGMMSKRSVRAASVQRQRKALSPSVDLEGYPALLDQIKSRIRAAQIKAALSVNRELIELYWSIGRDIVERQQAAGWGKSVVEQLALDLQSEFPGISTVSARNIWHARAFYLAYADPEKLKQSVSVFSDDTILKTGCFTNERSIASSRVGTNSVGSQHCSPAKDRTPRGTPLVCPANHRQRLVKIDACALDRI